VLLRAIRSFSSLWEDRRGNALVATTLALPIVICAGAAAIDGALWYLGNSALREAANNASYVAAAAPSEASARDAVETVFRIGEAKYGKVRQIDLEFSKKDNRDVAEVRVQTLLKLPVSGILAGKMFVLEMRAKSSELDRSGFVPTGEGGDKTLVKVRREDGLTVQR
jgi:hypothetical protein